MSDIYIQYYIMDDNSWSKVKNVDLMKSMKSWKVNNILDCIMKNQAYVLKTFNKEILY